jgi:RND family efflux transporter MFP subunit
MKRILILLPVVVAIVVVVVLVRTRSGPSKKDAGEVIRPLRVITVPTVDLRPRSVGYGLAEPGRVWRAVAQVKGEVVSIHPKLEAGELVDQGSELLRINPADYELAVAQLKANIAETRAKLDELTAEKENRYGSLQIEKRSLEFARKSVDRLRELLAKDAVPQDQVDREERSVLQQEQAIQELENALTLIPARREALKAALGAQKANLEQAEIDLKRTIIKAPFDCRLSAVEIEKGQYLNAGQQLFEAHGTGLVEIEAMFRPEQMRNLLPLEKRKQFQPGLSMQNLQELFDLKVIIRVSSGSWLATWPARFDRIREIVDPRTRAINVVAVVDEPYDKIIPGVRPALVRGMYCEMELVAPSLPNTVVVPRSAIRNGLVYVVDSEGRLQSRTVSLAFAQDGFVVIEEGLTGGETIVVSDPAPAIEGMKIEAVTDVDLQQRIVVQAEKKDKASR